MTFYQQPERELTAEEKLLAAVIELNQHVPGGYQIGLGLQLNRAIAEVEELFTAHALPVKEEILAELKAWHSHAEAGLTFVQPCQRLFDVVIRQVSAAADNAQAEQHRRMLRQPCV